MKSAAPTPPRALASFSIDVEQDCPPFMTTTRGMVEGMPLILDLLAEQQIPATFFTTGEMARQYPELMARIVSAGHELGCHGDLHRDFSTLSETQADEELCAALNTLRAFGPVHSFRAPYLRFPATYCALLTTHGLQFDSSLARYKFGSHHTFAEPPPGLIRVPVSATSSVLRLPAMIRSFWLGRLPQPLILFIHPWEAVDFRRSQLRLDCRFKTGPGAVESWRKTLQRAQQTGFRFKRLDEIAPTLVARH